MKYLPNIFIDIIGVALGLGLLWFVFGKTATQFGALGLGEGTSAIFETYNNRRIHCGAVDDAKECLQDLEASQNRTRVVLLGWSQLHGINHYRPGDHGTPWLLTDKLHRASIDLLTFSHGNANPKEHFIFFNWLRDQYHFDGLIIGAWLQGMREEGVRPSIAKALDNPTTRSSLQQTQKGRDVLSMFSQSQGTQTQPNTIETVSPTPQKQLESAMVEWLSENVGLWALRPEADGQIRVFFRSLTFRAVQLRNWVLGLERQKWVWPIPVQRYQTNLQYIEAMLVAAHESGKKVLVYIPPRPKNVHFPFQKDLYARFKIEVKALADAHGASFANLEDCVDGPVWGKTRDGAGDLVQDFTHFSADGHSQLAACLYPNVMSAMGDKP